MNKWRHRIQLTWVLFPFQLVRLWPSNLPRPVVPASRPLHVRLPPSRHKCLRTGFPVEQYNISTIDNSSNSTKFTYTCLQRPTNWRFIWPLLIIKTPKQQPRSNTCSVSIVVVVHRFDCANLKTKATIYASFCSVAILLYYWSCIFKME